LGVAKPTLANGGGRAQPLEVTEGGATFVAGVGPPTWLGVAAQLKVTPFLFFSFFLLKMSRVFILLT
jgi:hypothetical protein